MLDISRTLIALWSFLLLPSLLSAEDKTKSQVKDFMVAMTDGIELATTIYLPEGKLPFPVIVARTPYNKDGLKGEAAKFCRNGYAFVAQDLRGRFKSKGHHSIIFHNDGWTKPRDGQDTLKWIAAQPWCNGKIGSTGGSALGITQNMAAPVAPSALKAQFIVVALSDRESFEEERLLEPGKVYEVTVDLWSTSLVFNKGHKIRVAVSSSNAPRFDPNPNTGHAFRADKDIRVATNTIYFSEKYPSRVLLPICKEEAKGEQSHR